MRLHIKHTESCRCWFCFLFVLFSSSSSFHFVSIYRLQLISKYFIASPMIFIDKKWTWQCIHMPHNILFNRICKNSLVSFETATNQLDQHHFIFHHFKKTSTFNISVQRFINCKFLFGAGGGVFLVFSSKKIIVEI